ncbi:LytR/AlgR family response regulator transcription factor [Psychroserpens sp. XS_ASV72]|uniref:LytR/AlgR family response regulator transcription factor n=1 Tax=Psychroserpens sp. XS_ASV72 TaxID=3241293 RepID=UPI003514810F
MRKIAIIDDNKSVRSAMASILEHNFKNLFEIKQAQSVLKGHQLILEFKPDIVLLDIEMGDGTGLDLIHLFSNIDFKLIFITAHKEYALKAIKLRPYGYLLKPINPFDLIKIINFILSEKPQETTQQDSKKIVVKNQDKSIVLETENIIRLQADGAYTKILTTNGKYLASKNLKHFCELLKESSFLRVHHSHLVNPNFIKTFHRHAQCGLTLKNGETIPVSSRKSTTITSYLENLC